MAPVKYFQQTLVMHYRLNLWNVFLCNPLASLVWQPHVFGYPFTLTTLGKSPNWSQLIGSFQSECVRAR